MTLRKAVKSSHQITDNAFKPFKIMLSSFFQGWFSSQIIIAYFLSEVNDKWPWHVFYGIRTYSKITLYFEKITIF